MRPARHVWTNGRIGGEGAELADESAPVEITTTRVSRRPPPARQERPKRLRVLVVEPAAVLRNIMAHALTVQGYEVYATDRIGAIEQRIAAFDPHVVVTEASLQDGKGEQVCATVQSWSGKLVPVILMSGAPEPELEARAKTAGADRSFCKARGLSHLLDMIEELTSEVLY